MLVRTELRTRLQKDKEQTKQSQPNHKQNQTTPEKQKKATATWGVALEAV